MRRTIAFIIALFMILAVCPAGAVSTTASAEHTRAAATYEAAAEMTRGKTYIIAVDNGDNTVTALAKNSSNAVAAVTLSLEADGSTIKTTDTTVAWEYNASGNLLNGGRYLYYSSSALSTSSSYGRVFTYADGVLSLATSSSTRYITFANGAFGAGSDAAAAAQIVVFEQTDDGVEKPVDGDRYLILEGGNALTCTPSNEELNTSTGYYYYGLEAIPYTEGGSVYENMVWTIYNTEGGYYFADMNGNYLNASYESGTSSGIGHLYSNSDTDVWQLSGTSLTSANAGKSLKYESSVNFFTVRTTGGAITLVKYEGTPEPAPTATPEPTAVPEVRYHETTYFTAGNNYIIAAQDDVLVQAIAYNGGFSAAEMLVFSDDDGSYIMTNNANAVWTRTAEGYLSHNGNYMYPGSGGMNTSATSGRVVNYEDGRLSVTTSNGSTYYVTYSGGAFATSTDAAQAATFRLFTDGEDGPEPTAAPTPTPTPEPTATPTPAPEVRYNETTYFTAGNNYIVAVDDEILVQAISYDGSALGAAEMLVFSDDDGNYIMTNNANVVWNRTADGCLAQGTNAFYPTSSNGIMVGNYTREIDYANGHLTFSTSAGTRYIGFENGAFTVVSDEASAAIFRIFTDGEDGPEPTATPEPTPEPTPDPAVSVPENGKQYVIVADDNYALTYNDTDVNFSNSGSGTQIYLYTGMDGVPFTGMENATADMLWTIWERDGAYIIMSADGRYLNGTYVTTAEGYTGDLKLDSVQDNWTIVSGKLRSANASSTASSDKFLVHSNGSAEIVDVFTVRSQSSASTIRFYEYTGEIEPANTPEPAVTPEPTQEPTPAPEVRYNETTYFTAGNNYIVAVDDEILVQAISYDGSALGAAEMLVFSDDDGNYIMTNNANVVWTRTADGCLAQGTNAFYPTSSNGIMVGNYTREIDYANGHLTFSTSAGTRYIGFENGAFTVVSDEASAAIFRIFTDGEDGPEPTATPEPTPEPTPDPAVSVPENGKQYVIVADDNYALTYNDTDVNFSNSGSGTQIYLYTGMDGVPFTGIENATADMLWTIWERDGAYIIMSADGRYLNGTYVTTAEGYTGDLKLDNVQDNWTIVSGKLRSANASSTASSDKFLVHSNGSAEIVDVFTVRSQSSASTIRFYEYTGEIEPANTPEPTPAPTPEPNIEVRYVETDHFEANNDYIIAVTKDDSTVTAIANGGGTSVTAADLAVTNASVPYIVTENTAVVFNRNASGYMMNGGRCLYPTSSGTIGMQTYNRAIDFADGIITFSTTSDGTCYFTFADGAFATTKLLEEAGYFRIFVRTEVNLDELPETHQLTVRYIYEDGTEAAAAYTAEIEEGASYSVVSPVIEGYTADIELVEGVMGDSDMVITVTYTANGPEVIPGDVDCNGVVDMSDVSLLFSYLNGGGSGISAQGMLNADANGDGFVSVMDISAIYSIIANS